MPQYILALDQGTTSNRSIVFDHDGRIVSSAQVEFPQLYPQPGHVEHDPEAIWSTQLATAKSALEQARLSAKDIAAIGVVHVPEGRRIFGRLTVNENLDMGAFVRRDRRAIAEDKERMLVLFPRLRERLKQVAGTLSGGEQQMLAAARALMARPRVLLMDEPSMGLAPMMVEQVFETIRRINEQGVTILLVEQNAWQALEIADRGYVMETGKIILADTASALRTNPQVEQAYLGGEL